MPIRILPPAVAAGIAAGEVIERPASVVKELVENSLDAGARTISVEINQGGLQSIRVTDDGCGIPDEEVELAFHRHATSKLVSLDGLARIGTLGFRGEALASIAAASHVRMTTRPGTAASAVVIEATGVEVTRRGREAAATGTTVQVDALFSTVPARLKFIRSAPAETARIRQVLDHMAMANPEVRFTLKREQRTLLQTAGNGNLRDVLASVHGGDLASRMLEVTASANAAYRVRGLVSPPEFNRTNRTGISLFVNGRWVLSQSLSVAVQEAYRGLLMEGRYPLAALFIEVPPELVDVNVHPNKREVRFRHDGDAFSSVERSVREALIAAHPVVEARGLFPSQPTEPQSEPQAFELSMTPNTEGWAPLPEPVAEPAESVAPVGALLPDDQEQPVTDERPPEPPRRSLRVLGQISNAYIVAEGQDGMHLIDQHAAHESVLFYRLLKQWEDRNAEVQLMLDPLPVELAAEQVETLAKAHDILERYGIAVEAFGETTYLLRSVPAMARRVDGARLLSEVLDIARTAGTSAPDLHHEVAASIACHSAVRAGQALGQQEMEALANALINETNPNHCPHGRPTTIKVTTSMLEREFGRT